MKLEFVQLKINILGILNHSFGMAHSFVDTIGDVDVISDAEVKFSFLETFETRQLCDNSLRLQGQAGSNPNLNLKSRMFS